MAAADRRQYLAALVAILVLAFAARMFVAYAMPNMVWPDELYQSFEQAHRLAFGYGIVPWEFRDGTRSWMVPGVLAAAMKVTSWLTSSVTAYLMACAGVLSLISLAPVWGAFQLAFGRHGLRAAIVAGSAVALWFELVYFAPKGLSEAVAGNLLAAGIVLAITCAEQHGPVERRHVIAFTVALTLAAMLRIQLSIAAFAVFVLVVRKLPRPRVWTAVLTGGAVVLAAGLLDWLTWSYPFQSYVGNVMFNVVEGKASKYGTASWYAYFEVYGRIWGLGAIPILALAAVGARRAPLLAIGAVLVLVAHIPIAHKEYRFAYPAMLLVIMLAGLGLGTVVHWVETRRTARFATLAAAGCIAVWLAGSLALAGSYHSSKTQLAHVWVEEQDHWARRRGGLEAMRLAGADPDTCAIGLGGIGWGDTGGYTYLHRDIPIFPFRTPQVMVKYFPHFNVLLARPDQPETFGPFVRGQCWPDLCIYVRAGECTPLEGFDVNDVMYMMGQ